MYALQINEALNDAPQEGLLDFSLRAEVEQILSVGKRIAACMARRGLISTIALADAVLCAVSECVAM